MKAYYSILLICYAAVSWNCSNNPVDSSEVSEAPISNPRPPVLVIIENGEFQPSRVNIIDGRSIRWRNDDDQVRSVQTVTWIDSLMQFKSPKLAKGETFEHAFTIVGEYTYYSYETGHQAHVTVRVNPSSCWGFGCPGE